MKDFIAFLKCHKEYGDLLHMLSTDADERLLKRFEVTKTQYMSAVNHVINCKTYGF